MLSLFCVLILSMAVWYMQFIWKRRRLIKMVNKFEGPPTLPIFGNALQFSGNCKDVLLKATKLGLKYKNPFRMWILYKPYIILTNPEDFQIVANKTLEKDDVYGFFVDIFGDSIFTSKVNKWKIHRSLFKSAFNPLILGDFFLDVFNSQNNKLIQLLGEQADKGECFNLWPFMISTSINSISETALGCEDEFSDLSIAKYSEAVLRSAEIVSHRLFRPWLHMSLIFTIYKLLKGFDSIFRIVREYPLKILDTKRKKLNQETVSPTEEKGTKNFIGILLELHQKEILTDQEIKDEVSSIMFGGSETTAVTNSFLLLMLAMKQDIQDKVYEEVSGVFGDSNRFPTITDLFKLDYLEQCIKETLRRFSIVPAVFRYALDDIELSGKQIIPAGANIALLISMIHQDPSIYPNPMEWNPSNFDPDRVAQRHNHTFVPFSSGPRGCIGQKYAYVSMKAQLSTILRYFKITTNMKMEDLDFDLDIVFRNLRGYWVKLERRS